MFLGWVLDRLAGCGLAWERSKLSLDRSFGALNSFDCDCNSGAQTLKGTVFVVTDLNSECVLTWLEQCFESG